MSDALLPEATAVQNFRFAYSEGFSPHQLLSFASPLGVGISSTGEYFDMVLAEDMKTDEIVKRLNATMVEGMEVLSARHVPDGKASKAMSLVAGADYLVQFREGKMPEIDLETKVPEFFALPQIEIMRKTKRSEKLTDIRPWIYDMKAKKSGVWMQLSTGSVSNLKPELVMEAFCKWCGVELPPVCMHDSARGSLRRHRNGRRAKAGSAGSVRRRS